MMAPLPPCSTAGAKMAVTLHTSLGDIKLELFCDLVPRTCEVSLNTSEFITEACSALKNFMAHCALGTYEGTLFHRNIRDFMVQGGDPTGTGKGGECVWGGLMDDEFHPALKHDRRGVVSMANRGPGTNGCQFFITYGEHKHLNNQYSVFGRVIDGFDVLDAIEKTPVGKKNRPVSDIVIKSVTIHANPIADANA